MAGDTTTVASGPAASISAADARVDLAGRRCGSRRAARPGRRRVVARMVRGRRSARTGARRNASRRTRRRRRPSARGRGGRGRSGRRPRALDRARRGAARSPSRVSPWSSHALDGVVAVARRGSPRGARAGRSRSRTAGRGGPTRRAGSPFRPGCGDGLHLLERGDAPARRRSPSPTRSTGSDPPRRPRSGADVASPVWSWRGWKKCAVRPPSARSRSRARSRPGSVSRQLPSRADMPSAPQAGERRQVALVGPALEQRRLGGVEPDEERPWPASGYRSASRKVKKRKTAIAISEPEREPRAWPAAPRSSGGCSASEPGSGSASSVSTPALPDGAWPRSGATRSPTGGPTPPRRRVGLVPPSSRSSRSASARSPSSPSRPASLGQAGDRAERARPRRPRASSSAFQRWTSASPGSSRRSASRASHQAVGHAVSIAASWPRAVRSGGMRVGVVDLGTNSTRLLVADVEDGDVREVERELAITRLGEDVDARRRLLPDRARARAQRPRGLPARGRGARRRAGAGARDERRPRRRERRGVPRRDRVELRLRDAAALRRRGGAPDVPRRLGRARRSRTGRSSWTSAAARPSSCSEAPTASRSTRASTSAACA